MEPQDSVSWWSDFVLLHLVGRDPAAVPGEARALLHAWTQAALAELGDDWQARVREALEKIFRKGSRPPPPMTVKLLMGVGLAALRKWIGDPARAEKAAEKLTALRQEARIELCGALIRLALDVGTDPDADLVKRTLAAVAAGEEGLMANYELDPRGLPAGLKDKAKADAFIAAVSKELEDNLGAKQVDFEAFHAVVIGGMVLDGYTVADGGGFKPAIYRAWLEGIKKVKQSDGAEIPYHKVYATIDGLLRIEQKDKPITYQALASVCRYVLARTDDIPPGHAQFSNLVRVALDNYVSGAYEPDSLELPVLDGAGGAQEAELIEENIRAAALIYGGYQYEEMMLFRTVDRIAELFVNGILPIGNDDAGRALDEYHFEAFKRLTEPERRMHYSRILGVAGGDVSKEAQVNSGLDAMLLRFISGLAEYDREKRIGALFNGKGTRGLTLMLEQIRQTGRDLASNLTYYGYGATHFFAFRLTSDIGRAHAILNMPQILKAYAVDTPRQVIERVASQEFGVVPNIYQRETMARSGHELLKLVAKHCPAWRANGVKPLFGKPLIDSDIDDTDEALMIRHAQLWLAVNGYKDEQIATNAQPGTPVYSPSIPAQPAPSGNGSLDRLRQMVAAGQTPSMSDLQALVAGARN